MKALLLSALFLTAAGAAWSADPESFELDGVYVTLNADGSRWLEFSGDGRGLYLSTEGKAILSGPHGQTLSEGSWDPATGEISGVKGFEASLEKAAERAAIAAKPLPKEPVMPGRPTKGVRTGSREIEYVEE